MGALTLKPSAYRIRPWDVKSYESVDLSDCIGANISLDVCDGTLYRIRPPSYADPYLLSEYVTDKVRFSYDSLNLQRLNSPMLRSSVKSPYLRISWIKVNHVFRDFLSDHTEPYKVFIGNNVSLDSLVILKHLFSLKNIISLDSSTRCTDFQDWYSIDESLLRKNINLKNGYIFTFSFNLRLETPKLNLFFRKVIDQGKSLRIYSVGANFPSTFDVVNVGSVTFFMYTLINGLSRLLPEFISSSTEYIYFLVSDRIDSSFFSYLLSLSDRLNGFLNSVGNFISKDSICCVTVPTSLNSTSSSDLGLCNNNSFTSERRFSNFLLSFFEDNFNYLDSHFKNNMMVYCGSHGDYCAAKLATCVIPVLHTYETSFSFYSWLSNYVYVPPGLPIQVKVDEGEHRLPGVTEFFDFIYRASTAKDWRYYLMPLLWGDFKIIAKYFFRPFFLRRANVTRGFFYLGQDTAYLFEQIYDYVGKVGNRILASTFYLVPFSYAIVSESLICSDFEYSFANSFYPSFLLSDSFFRSSQNLSLYNESDKSLTVFF